MGKVNLLSPTDVTVPAGAFNRRITIQQPVDVSDGQGGSTRTWSTVFSTWAYIEDWKGWERWNAQQVYPNMIVRVLIRYRPSQTVTDSMRMLYNSKVYNIRAAYDKGAARRTIEMLCEALQDTGSIA